MQPQITFNALSVSEIITIEPADACVEILSPNQTSQWIAGTTQRIEWNGSGSAFSDEILFSLLLNYQQVSLLGNPTASTGYFDWEIPENQQPDTRYQIRATSMGAVGVVFVTPILEISEI